MFPYNPNNGGDFWDKAIGKGFPLEKGSEGWVEDEFWDFCSGSSGTFQLIKDCFDEIRTAETLSEELKNMLDQ